MMLLEQTTGATPREPRTPIHFERAALRDGALVFTTPGGLDKALGEGGFFLEIPHDLDLAPAIRLSREFYRERGADSESNTYRGFRGREGVYFDREHFQTEHVLVDRPARVTNFPPALVATCDAMNDVALALLRNVLTHLRIPSELWHKVTGGAVDNRGTHWFASSHYRPERDQMGCAPHKDTGFMTVLYIDQEGLEASLGGEWVSIDPVPGHLVINFGASLEILTRLTSCPVRAILHRVRQTSTDPSREERFSFAAFVNPPATGWLYECHHDQTAKPYQSVEQFLAEFNAKTWNDRHDDFGIK